MSVSACATDSISQNWLWCSALKTMDHSAVFGATGWPPGAIGPISLSAQTNIWLDGAIFQAPTIYRGSRELNEVLDFKRPVADIAEGQSRARVCGLMNGAQSFEQPH